MDGRLARAWVGHNALHVVENGTGSFEEKIRKTVDVVCRSLGVPGPRSQPRWWIVRNVDEQALSQLEPAEWKLEHVFLRTSDGSESRVTKKSSVGGGPATYHHRVHRGVPSFGGAFTPSTRLVSISRCRGWSFFRCRGWSDRFDGNAPRRSAGRWSATSTRRRNELYLSENIKHYSKRGIPVG